MMGNNKKAVKETLRKHIMSVAPGLLLTLDVYSLRMYGNKFVDICVENVEKCGNVIKEACKDRIMTDIMLKILVKKGLRAQEENLAKK